jgi:CBS domain containing-hemolysin-like protein
MEKNRKNWFGFLMKVFPKKKSEINEIHYNDNNNIAEDLEQLLEARDMKVAEVMIPRADLVAINASSSPEEIKNKFIETGFLRLIVYGKDLDDIIGFIQLKDLIKLTTNDTSSIIKKTIYAAKSTKCFGLFEKMKHENVDMAVILDEYGGIEGVISVERLMEQIISTISHDEEYKDCLSIEQVSDNVYILDGRTSIPKVEELFKDVEFLSEEEGEYETIGGFILSYLDKIPVKGEKFNHVGGLEIEILDSTSRAIKKVKITRVNNTI